MAQFLMDVMFAVMGAEAIFGFLKYLISRHDKKHQSPERIMLRALGCDRLKVLLREWERSEVRKAADWEVIENLYTGYSQLGGNGEIRKLYEDCKKLPATD